VGMGGQQGAEGSRVVPGGNALRGQVTGTASSLPTEAGELLRILHVQ
jgi:hypothetical protein